MWGVVLPVCCVLSYLLKGRLSIVVVGFFPLYMMKIYFSCMILNG